VHPSICNITAILQKCTQVHTGARNIRSKLFSSQLGWELNVRIYSKEFISHYVFLDSIREPILFHSLHLIKH